MGLEIFCSETEDWQILGAGDSLESSACLFVTLGDQGLSESWEMEALEKVSLEFSSYEDLGLDQDQEFQAC